MRAGINGPVKVISARHGDARARLRRAVTRFGREENGAMLIFSIYIFIMILMVAGIGIDLMRFERDRSNLQYTLDRAVLAAADLEQTRDPVDVVYDYFAKSGLTGRLTAVNVEEGLGFRIVAASATMEMDTQFMHMTGLDTLNAPAMSGAEERIDGVEISLVLDVSGSMNSNSRLPNLKVAARDFIDQMVDNSEDGKLSISIIPYATQVSAPQELFDELTVSNEHNYSRCINFEAADFNSTTINPNVEMERTMHFDPWNDFDGRDNDPVEMVRDPVCEDSSSREMVLLEKDKNTLKTFISNLWADGNTSIDVGMKWGTALLDPSMRPVISALVDGGHISNDFSARPHAHDDGETLKVIVLMTDGQNTSQYYINEGFRTGDSNIWWNDEQEIYSVYAGLDEDDLDNDGITNEPSFFWPMNNTWRDHAYGEGTYEETTTDRECTSYRRNGSCRRYDTIESVTVVNEPGSAELLSYPELWAFTTLKRNVKDNYYPWMNDSEAYNDWYYGVRSYVDSAIKDARTKAICDAAKAEQIIVFTIGFEAPYGGRTVLQDCASSDSHFFDVDGLEISDAFSAIASSIRQLRLTQ